jgi:hypothetical protein
MILCETAVCEYIAPQEFICVITVVVIVLQDSEHVIDDWPQFLRFIFAKSFAGTLFDAVRRSFNELVESDCLPFELVP